MSVNRTHRSFLLLVATILFSAPFVPTSGFAGSLLISWDAVQDSRLTGYRIRYGTTPKIYSQSVDVGKQTNFTIQGLTEGATYYFVIVGYDSNRIDGSPSAEASGTVLSSSYVAASTTSSTTVTVSWSTNKPSDSQVEYGTTTSYGSSTSLDPSLTLNHSQVLQNLQPSTTYNYRVRSRDQGGSVTLSGNYTFTTSGAGDSIPPGDVTNFTAIPGSGRVALRWTNPADADFKGVMIRYRTDGVYPASKTDGLLAGDRRGLPRATDYFDHLNLNNGVTYSYSAFTYDSSQNFSNTAHAQATPARLSITTLSPTRGNAGTSVVIDGTGFGATQGNSTVKFRRADGRAYASVSSWSTNSIIAVVPANATSGSVIVTVNGVQSNGVYFKVGSSLGAPERIRVSDD